eukprot:scaffold77871_cov62-Phaeocystis_antarctica.AAC.3
MPLLGSNLSPLELIPPKEGGFPRGFAAPSSAPSDRVPGALDAPGFRGAPAFSGSAHGAFSSAAAAATSARLGRCHMPLCELYLSWCVLRLLPRVVLRGTVGAVSAVIGVTSCDGSPDRAHARISFALIVLLLLILMGVWPDCGRICLSGVVGAVGAVDGDAPCNDALIGPSRLLPQR